MRPLLTAAGLAGFAAVALGAFGAHGLEGRLSPEAKDWWETATLYALTHAVAALGLALHGQAKAEIGAEMGAGAHAGAAFILGTVLFSGSLYAMALFSLAGGAPAWFGMITPLGGLSFLAGWALVIADGIRRR